jgi:hypothetical protein
MKKKKIGIIVTFAAIFIAIVVSLTLLFNHSISWRSMAPAFAGAFASALVISIIVTVRKRRKSVGK